MTAEAKLPFVFRESFILLLEGREQQEAVRLLDQTIHSAVLEGSGCDSGPWLQREASGALGDLRQAIESITDLGRWVDQANLDRQEARLAIEAGDVAAELKSLVDRLDAALAAYLAEAEAL